MTIATGAQITLIMLLWAACFPLIALGLEFSPHLTFAALRAIIAGGALTVIAFALRRSLPRGWRIWTMIILIGLGATSLGFLGMFHAAEFVSPGIATAIANTQQLLAAILAAMVLNEKLTARGMAGLGLGFAGILVIAAPQLFAGEQGSYIVGIGYITLAALGITVSNVLIKRIAGEVDALMAMGLQLLIGSIPLILAAWIAEDPMAVRWSFTFIGSLLAISLLGTALVYWMWFAVLRRVQLTRANAFSFMIPVFGLALGGLFFDEILSLLQLAGIVLTVIGVALVIRSGTRPENPDGDRPRPVLQAKPLREI